MNPKEQVADLLFFTFRLKLPLYRNTKKMYNKLLRKMQKEEG